MTDFGLKIGLEGDKSFRKSIAEIHQTFHVLGSEMKLTASQFNAQDKSVAALSARNEGLNKSISAQKDKIDTLQAAVRQPPVGSAVGFPHNFQRAGNFRARRETIALQNELP